MKHRLWTPRLFAFVYTTGALAGLGALAYWFLTSPQKGLLTSSNDVRYALVGAFWAILGGVAINYKGISDHRHDAEWENGWMLWYLLRPFSALTVGLVTYAILDVVTQSSPSVPALAVLAFTFGTQEHRFFLLLYRAGGLVVSTPGDQQGIEITSINPATGKAGTVLMVQGQGFATAATVTIGGQALTDPVVSPDGSSIAGIVPAGIGPTGSALDVTVTNPDDSARRAAKKFTVS